MKNAAGMSQRFNSSELKNTQWTDRQATNEIAEGGGILSPFCGVVRQAAGIPLSKSVSGDEDSITSLKSTIPSAFKIFVDPKSVI